MLEQTLKVRSQVKKKNRAYVDKLKSEHPPPPVKKILDPRMKTFP